MSNLSAHKSKRVVLGDRVEPATIVVAEGKIADIKPYDYEGPCQDWQDLALLPGAIDPHVHFNEPGRTHWEGWETGTKAALAGGVTTVVEMPLNSIPSTLDRESLKLKTDSMAGKLYCNVGLWGGAVPTNIDKLEELYQGGVLGFKCFLSDPGTEEFENLREPELEQAMTEIARLGAVLLVHAEWPDELLLPDPEIAPTSYQSWLGTRPVEAERAAVRRMVELSRATGCRTHIVHVSSHQVLDVLAGTDLTCETCAHYLAFCAEEIADRATNFKCAPPIREKDHQNGLWDALGNGQICMVTSDHSPCPPDLKNNSFLDSWGGIAGVQMLVTSTWTGASSRGYELTHLARWLCAAPARLAGLQHCKGALEIGKDADFFLFDPEAEFTCRELFHRHAGSPYQGRRWKGRVAATFLAGQAAFREGLPGEPMGTYIQRA